MGLFRLTGVLLAVVCLDTGAQVVAPVITISGTAPRETDTERAKPVTQIDRKRIDRWQSSTVFEAAEGAAGVSLNGGSRASGTLFNIRGYNDTDDVLIKLDGAQKNFEKYRFGGTFIEPELLKGIRITRGPDLLSGAAALGGTVSASTRDAADLLRPGERYGARLKYGTESVNEGIARTGIVYGRPRDDIDLVAAATRRTAGDYRDGSGARLQDSTTNQRSGLVKGTWFASDAVSLGWSTSIVGNRSREAYDATGGQPGLFGSVIRDVDDTTHTLTAAATGADGWIDLSVVAGQSQTHVIDFQRPGQTPFANGVTGDVTDTFDYRVSTFEARNTARFRTGAVSHELVVLSQAVRNARVVRRVTENATINARQYPDGFNGSQPSGTRDTVGLVVVHTLSFGPFTVAPGFRRDRHRVTADGTARVNMMRFGEAHDISVHEDTASFSATARLPRVPLLLGYRYVQAFRPPAIDEYFTQGAFSRCIRANLGALAPASGICGTLYRPERADTQEWSLTATPRAVNGLRLDGRLAYFRNERRHLLSSLRAEGTTGIGQPGWEHREGFELEASVDGRAFFGQFAYTRIRGKIFDGVSLVDLYTAPGDTVSITLGARLAEDRVDVGFRWREVGSSAVVVGLANGNRPIVGRAEGYQLIDLFAGWRPTRDLELRAALNNARDELYYLAGTGGAIGAPAPGRSLRLTVSLQF